MDGDAVSPVASSSEPPRKKAKPWYKQAFNDEWLTDIELKDWIQPDPNNRFRVKCKVCSCSFKNTNKSGLLAHKRRRKHVKNMKARDTLVEVGQFCKTSNELSLEDKVSQAELVLTAFMVEHNTPLSQIDHLIECCKRIFPDSAIAQNLSIKCTESPYVMRHGIPHYEQPGVVDICRGQSFSIIVYGSTDVSASQIMAVVVRFWDKKSGRVVDSLLDFIDVEDGKGISLFAAVKKLLSIHAIPLSNIIGFAADNCANMMDTTSSLQAQLKKNVPHAFVLGCVCHSFALCANAASKHLPSWVEIFIKNLCLYFSFRSKRNDQFQLLQDVVKAQKHKVLKLCETRWLSHEAVIEKILEQWEALKLFFQSEASVDEIDGVDQILAMMNTVGTKHMLLFLGYILAKVSIMNNEFQSESFRMHKVYASVLQEYRFILSMFIRPEILKHHHYADIDPSDVLNHKKVTDVQLGGRCEAQLLQHPLGDKEIQFRQDVLAFLVELCIQIRSRFPLEQNGVLAQMQLLDPKKALKIGKPSIIPLASQFPSILSEDKLDRLSDQWHDLELCCDDLECLPDGDPPAFWNALLQIKDVNGKIKFGVLAEFMGNMMALPHSSATVGRVFSLKDGDMPTTGDSQLDYDDTICDTSVVLI